MDALSERVVAVEQGRMYFDNRLRFLGAVPVVYTRDKEECGQMRECVDERDWIEVGRGYGKGPYV